MLLEATHGCLWPAASFLVIFLTFCFVFVLFLFLFCFISFYFVLFGLFLRKLLQITLDMVGLFKSGSRIVNVASLAGEMALQEMSAELRHRIMSRSAKQEVGFSRGISSQTGGNFELKCLNL